MSYGADLTTTRRARAPRWVKVFNPVARSLLAAGAPMGVNALVTIRGRKSGLPRSTPLAIIKVAGRRWIWAPWGEVDWVRNLRAAGHATITVRGRDEDVIGERAGRPRAGRVLPRHTRPVRSEHPVRLLVRPHRRRHRPR